MNSTRFGSPSASAGARRTPFERVDREIEPLAEAQHLDRDRLVDPFAVEQPDQIVDPGDLIGAEADDDVLGLEPGRTGRTPCLDSGDKDAETVLETGFG